MRAQGLAARTVSERVRLLGRMSTDAGVEPEDLTPRQILRLLASPELSQASRATYHGVLRAWFRWLREQEVRRDDPMAKMPRPKVPRRRPRPIETAQLEQLLASRMHRRTRVMILLAAYQGLRVSEIARIRAEHVDLVGERLLVRGKGGVDDWLPLHRLVAREARGMPRAGWWFPTYHGNHQGTVGPMLGNSVSSILAEAMARAGVPGSAHCLRHWYGTELVRAGADVITAQTLLRHASVATTQIYVATSDERRAEAVVRLPEVPSARCRARSVQEIR